MWVFLVDVRGVGLGLPVGAFGAAARFPAVMPGTHHVAVVAGGAQVCGVVVVAALDVVNIGGFDGAAGGLYLACVVVAGEYLGA
ncbi:hypothetical protein [Trueperella pyogenes]